MEIGTSPTPKMYIIVNCPGEKARSAPVGGSKIERPRVVGLLRTVVTSNGRSVMGSQWRSRAWWGDSHGLPPVQIEELHADVVEPPPRLAGDHPQHRVVETLIDLACRQNDIRVELCQARLGDRFCRPLPSVRRNLPTQPEQGALANRLDRDGWLALHPRCAGQRFPKPPGRSDPPVCSRGTVFRPHPLPRLGDGGEKLEVFVRHVFEHGALVAQLVEIHTVASSLTSSWIFRNSSVMSMPAGHHVMHRPQPTQPDEPNWSNQ